jgi:gluconolactonase
MALDHDGRYLYVVQTTPASVIRFPIVGDHELGPAEEFGPPLGARRGDEFGERTGSLTPEIIARWGMADGSAFDAAGNLWVTVVGMNRISAITPKGELLLLAEDPAGDLLKDPTSIAWGGDDMRDIFIGSLTADYVLRGRTSVSGMRMLHQRRGWSG